MMIDTTHEILAAAIRQLLKPLVGLLIRHGIPHKTFAEYAKQAYADVAAKEFTVPGRKPSVSRVSLLTGLTRKDVSRLLKSPTDSSEPADRYSRAARVITTWVREPDFHDPHGQPRTLSAEGEDGFAGLVRRSLIDVPSRAVLDELLRVEAVVAEPDGRLHLVNRAYVPHAGDSEKLEILGTDVADLVASIDHNLTHPANEAFFQRKVAYDNVVASCLPELRTRVGANAQALLESFDRFLAQHDQDLTPEASGDGGKRAVIGIYYREHDMKGDS